MGNVNTTVGKQVVSDINDVITTMSINVVANSNESSFQANNSRIQCGGERLNPETGVVVQRCVDFKGPCPGITVNQSNKTVKQVTTSTTSNAVIDIKNNLGNNIEQKFKTTTEQKSEWLSIALGVNTTVTDSIASAVNKVVTNIDSNTSTSCQGFIFDSNNSDIMICAPLSGPVFVNQSNDVKTVANCTAKLVFDAIASNTELNSNIQKAENNVTQTSEGPLSFLKNLGYFFLVIVVIVVIAAVVMAVFHSKKQPPQRPYYPYDYSNYYTQNGYSQVQAGVA